MRAEPLPIATAVLQPVIDWIASVPFEYWPQQTRLADGLIRPAMVTDLGWASFGKVTDPLVQAVARDWSDAPLTTRNRLLSVVMPGATIDPHTDELGADWLARIHVPLLTNDDAMFISGDTVRHLPVGFAHEVNTRERHAAWNAGTTPRVHLMFDLHNEKP
jgi:hypothetical protein